MIVDLVNQNFSMVLLALFVFMMWLGIEASVAHTEEGAR